MSDGPLKAEFFIIRKDGKMVPLIAVDELPHHITIVNVSRTMSPFDITGMKCVGQAAIRHRHYVVREAPELAASSEAPRSDELKAKYFVTRETGNMVPLVAMDEMPEYFVVDDVPREVSSFHIAGMTCVGLSDVRDGFHKVEDVKNAPLSYFTTRATMSRHSGQPASDSDAPLRQDEPALSLHDLESEANIPISPTMKQEINTPTEPLSEISSSTANMPITSTNTANVILDGASGKTPSVPPRLGSQNNNRQMGFSNGPVPGAKIYCSFWLRNGECDYQQQGCKFKHEMPLDQDTLLRLGHRDIPRWYRERYGLGSYLAAGGSGAGFGSQTLMSTAATSSYEKDMTSRVVENWRAAPKSNDQSPSFSGQRGNRHNPRSNNPPIRLSYGKLRSNETLQGRQQFEAIQALGSHAIIDRYHRSRRGAHTDNLASGARPEEPSRRFSVSTIMSDVEATVTRQDALRRAQEDAMYTSGRDNNGRIGVVSQGMSSLAVQEDDVAGGRRGSNGGQRGRRGRNGDKMGGSKGHR